MFFRYGWFVETFNSKTTTKSSFSIQSSRQIFVTYCWFAEAFNDETTTHCQYNPVDKCLTGMAGLPRHLMMKLQLE